MFADLNNREDSPYIMSDVDPDIFLVVLEFIYTNCVSLNTKNVGLCCELGKPWDGIVLVLVQDAPAIY